MSDLSDGKVKYTISVPNENAVIQFSFIGFTTQEMTVGRQSILNVSLAESADMKDIPNLDLEAIQSSGDFRAGSENASLPSTRKFMFSLNARF